MNKCTYCEANALVTYCQACGTFAPDTQLAALAAERDALREALKELSRLAREVSRNYSGTSWNVGAIRRLNEYIDNKDKEVLK